MRRLMCGRWESCFTNCFMEKPHFGLQRLSTSKENIVEGKFCIDKRLSPAAIDLLRRVLRANPDDRYSVEQVLSHTFIKVT
jgi:serine/threonine protein kinase